MADDSICPYFGMDEDLCDVGCGYISPSDVHQIIRYCRAQHQQCPRCQQLAAHFAEQQAAARSGGALHSARRELDPAPLNNRNPAPLISGARSATACLSLHEASAERCAPVPLGLLGTGMTILLLGVQQATLLPLDAMMIAMGLFYGGLAQIIAGIFEWRRNQSFAATTFCAWGLFWLTLVGMVALPRAGIGDLPSPLALTSYLVLWGLFSGVLFIGALRLGRLLPLIFANLSLFLFLLALSEAHTLVALDRLAGWQGVLTGILAVYAGCAQMLNDIYRRPLLPT